MGGERGLGNMGRWFWYLSALLTLCGASGCTLDQRTPATLTTEEGASRPISDVVGAGKSQLGAACSDATGCDSGFCVDGVCCAESCKDLCATCSAPGSEGTCVAASSDVACPALLCGADTECATYDRAALAFNCAGYGKCQQEATCALVAQPPGTPCQAGAGHCDGSGACSVEGKKSLAAACSNDSECAEGHCVAVPGGGSICCDAGCTGVCEQCSATGRCVEAPATDAACATVACPTDNACRDYSDTLAGGACRGFGQCAAAGDCSYTALRPPSSCQCAADGRCELVAGESCTSAADCVSGACVAGLDGNNRCCAKACGPGSFCSSDGSACVACEGSQVTCAGSTAQSCVAGTVVSEDCSNGCTPAAGCNALPGVGSACPDGQCQDGASCQADVGGVARCCVRDCAQEGKVCATNGSCVCADGQVDGASGCALSAGDPCTDTSQCQAGLACADGVCCNTSCGGACQRCNAQGSVGQCVFDAGDTAQCSSDQECAGVGQCELRLGARCTADALCHSGHCEALAGVPGAQICCGVSCGSAAPFCSSDGTRCVACASNADCANGCNTATGTCNPLRQLGDTCTQPAQCQSQDCLSDGTAGNVRRCCPANCAAGQLCNAQGQCVDPPGGAGASCSAGRTCQGGLFCVDGICCQTACNGPCQVCGAGGVCQAASTDLASCPSLGCGSVGQCQLAVPPPAGQCAGFGRCAQCQTTRAPAGSTCDAGQDGTCDAQGDCLFYDTGTQCTVGGTTMHCCPAGSAMTGARLDENVFKCITVPGFSGAAFLDTGTQRNGMHACPLGSVMIGLRDDQNQLACQSPGTGVSSEFLDGSSGAATQDAFPMHVCANGTWMTGIRADQNVFTCGQ